MRPRREFLLLVMAAVVFVALSENTSAPAKQPPRIAATHAAWRDDLQRLRTPGAGCFKTAYPRIEWKRVKCVVPPNRPYVPRHGHRAFTVGNNNDYAGEVTGTMNSAEGSFDSITGVTSETGQVNGSGGQVANTYSLQINTKPFTNSVCGGSPNAGCLGWQQFIYSSSSQAILIQYWLLRYNTTCPSGWNTFSFPMSTDIYCWRNGANTATVAKQAITNLANLRLVGRANASGNDSVTMFVGNTATAASNAGNMLNLGSAWTGAEFIIVGDCCSSQANFNAGATIVVRTTVHNGTTNPPTCVLEGFTGETNNLNLVSTAAIGSGASPAIVSTQSNSSTTAESCAAASGIGDTHLTTYKGLLYDFQAAGDFVLSQTPGFVVQTRQVSGAPTWPNASVNSAVGALMGKTRVALCLPNRLEVNGHAVSVSPGSPLLLSNGGDVSRSGNVYVIRGPRGDSLRAELHDKWIDVGVGLGRQPQAVIGLLANARNNVHSVATRGGAVLVWPLAFETLYGKYGNSWRVRPSASILCKGKLVRPSNPTRPFYVKNLKPEVAQKARRVCQKFHVRNKALLDACTLDVAVIGRAAAARVYVGARAPVAVGIPK
jgi:hypothetical protein